MESYLAQVVRAAPCCGWNHGVGWVVEIVNITPAENDSFCKKCDAKIPTGELLAVLQKGGEIPLFRLKRLPSPSEVEQYDLENELPLNPIKETTS